MRFNKLGQSKTIYDNFQSNTFNNVYEDVINQYPDQQNLNQDLTSTNLGFGARKHNKLHYKQSVDVAQQQDYIGSTKLTNTHKKLELKKIYQQSKINSFIYQTRQLISKSVQQIDDYVQINPKRQKQLKIYLEKIKQLDSILKDSLGSSDQIKVFTVKKVIMVLRSAGKIKSLEQYKNLIQQINQIGGITQIPQKQIDDQINQIIKQENKADQNQHKLNQRPHMKVRRSITQSYIMKNNFANDQNQELLSSNNSLKSDDLQFQKILQRVDQIHQDHIKKWQKHNQQIQQFENQKNQIKQKYSTFQSKMSTNRRVLKKHGLLKQFPQQIIKNIFKIQFNRDKNESQQYEQPKSSKKLSNSLPYLANEANRKKSKNLNQIKLRLQSLQNKKLQYPSGSRYLQKVLSSQRLSLSKRNNSKKSKQSKDKKRQSLLLSTINKQNKQNKQRILKRMNSQILKQRKNSQIFIQRKKQIIKTNYDKKSKQKQLLQPIQNTNNKSKFSQFSQKRTSKIKLNLNFATTKSKKLKLT